MAIRPTRIPTQSLNLVRGRSEDLLNDVVQQTDLNNFQDAFSGGVELAENFISGRIPELPSFDDVNLDISSLDIQQIGVDALAESITPATPLGATENLLKSYASYNYNLTFACLTVNELNFPDSTYRIRDPEVTVLRSGGGAPGKAKTAYESESAQLEYFIDDFSVGTIIAPTSDTRSSNATTFEFTVHEPYSMGLFLQTLMIASNKAGHRDYLKAPWAIIIDFVGWDDNGNPLSLGANVRRVFPLKLTNVEFNVNAGGSSYAVKAFAWNEQAQSSTTQTIPADEKITGSTLLEILQTGPESLTSILNKRIQERAQGSRAPINKDEIVIMFPNELTSSLGIANQAGTGTENAATMTEEEYYVYRTGGSDLLEDGVIDPDLLAQGREAYEGYLESLTTNNNVIAAIRRVAESQSSTNAIGRAEPVRSMAEGGATPFGREVYAHDNRSGTFRTDQISISNEFRSFQFPQSSSIEQIIEELVIISSFGRSAAQSQPDANGMIDWYRIHTQTFLVPDEEVRRQTGENPKVYVYAVVPYKVHSSVFSNASQPSVAVDALAKKAAKTYDYIYTGKNDDILDFEIQFNNSFYKALGTNINGSGDSRNATRDGASNPNNANFDNAGGTDSPTYGGDAGVRETPDPNVTGKIGGSTNDTPEVQVARAFNEAIVNNGVDMLTMDLTILGDPFYLADSGVGNYNSAPLAQQYTQDGTMDYQRGEIEVELNFKTPIDYNSSDGSIIFPSTEENVPIGAFSGLYKVITVQNSFSGGKFTQELRLVRRNNQDEREGQGTPDQTQSVTSSQGDDTTNTDNSNPPSASSGGGGSGANPSTATGSSGTSGSTGSGGSGANPSTATGSGTSTTTTTTTTTPTRREGVDVWGFPRPNR
jgi:hypothetical protein